MKKYDVFISFKNSDKDGKQTADSVLAEKLYDFLSKKGISVFFSNIELEFTGKAQYTKVIDDALDSSGFLIAVGCGKENLDSDWVRYEWESFLNDIRSGVKSGAEVFVLFQDMTINDLPRALRQQQAFDAADNASYEKLYNFITNAMGRRQNDTKEAAPAMQSNSVKAKINEMSWDYRRLWSSVTGQVTENGFSISPDGETLSIRNDYYEIADAQCFIELETYSEYRFFVDIMMTDFERFPEDFIRHPQQNGGACTRYETSKDDKLVTYGVSCYNLPEWKTVSWIVKTSGNTRYSLRLMNGTGGNACKGTAFYRNLMWEKIGF